VYIEPGSPWENGYCESFNSKLRDEFLNGEIFYSINELRVLAERWRVHYNTVRPHSSLGYKPPAPETLMTTAPCPRRRLSELRDKRATLTPHWHKRSGNPFTIVALARSILAHHRDYYVARSTAPLHIVEEGGASFSAGIAAATIPAETEPQLPHSDPLGGADPERRGLMMPIHWGLFDLALHAWRQPIERLVEVAKEKKIKLWVPEPGRPTAVVAGVEVRSDWWRR
jgi:hypothetical protein